MANQVDIVVLEEGPRNAIVRIAGFMDTSDIILNPAFNIATFTSNPETLLVGFRIDRLQYAVDPDIVLRAYWNSASPQLIAVMADSNALNFKDAGGLQPNQTLSGFNGAINVSTAGYTPGSYTGFTLVMSMVKLLRTR